MARLNHIEPVKTTQFIGSPDGRARFSSSGFQPDTPDAISYDTPSSCNRMDLAALI